MFAILINTFSNELSKDDSVKKYKFYKTLFLLYSMIIIIIFLIVKQIYDKFSI